MKLKNRIITAAIAYVVFMVLFTAVFMPMFYETTGGNEMVDVYLPNYSKSTADIENLINDYGKSGRAFMTNFFIADSAYIIISVFLFSSLIQGLTKNKYLSCIPFITGTFDALENIIVLYSGKSLNMDFIIFARIFASAKAVFLFTSLIIIITGSIRMLIKRMRKEQ